MRITLDTNVLVSAFISKRGHPATILDLVGTFEEITLVLSDEILKEFVKVMTRKEVRKRFGHNTLDVSELERAIRGIAKIVKVESEFKVVEEDPEGDVIVDTAYDRKADYIVSGDKHLLKLRKFKGVHVVSPRVFLAIVTRRFGDLILPKSDVA